MKRLLSITLSVMILCTSIIGINVFAADTQSSAREKFEADKPAIVEYIRTKQGDLFAEHAEKYMTLHNQKDSAYFGNYNGYNVYYVSTENQGQMYYSEEIGGYKFTVWEVETLGSALGVFAVKGKEVYTLSEAYNNGVITDISAVAETVADSGLIKVEKIEKPTTPTVKKTTVKLQKASAMLYIKGSTKIKADVENGVGKTTYKSSDKSIAKVDSNGKVTALKKGTAKITVTNNKVSKTFTVTVKKPFLNKTSLKIRKGAKFTLKVTGKVGKAKFITSNKKIAAVNQKGKITAKKKGNATVTVKTNGIKLKCKVNVR